VISETVDSGRNISVLEPECESLPVFPTRYSISSSWLYKYWTSCIAWTKEQEHTQTIVLYSFCPATAQNNQNTRITSSQGGDIPKQIRQDDSVWNSYNKINVRKFKSALKRYLLEGSFHTIQEYFDWKLIINPSVSY